MGSPLAVLETGMLVFDDFASKIFGIIIYYILFTIVLSTKLFGNFSLFEKNLKQ